MSVAITRPSEPLPLEALGQRLCETFPYLWQAILSPNEPDAQWQTITKYPLRPRVLWRYWQDGAQLVGVRFDHTTRYGMLDIDADSPYHPAQTSAALTLIRTALETIGLYRTVLIRSSFSGGLHLYIPLPEEVPTFGLAVALKQCLEAQGLVIAQGKLEIFPNVKTYAKPGTFIEYNAHRLPLQPASGSYLLDDDCNPMGADLGQFFQQWDLAAAGQDRGELNQAIATAKTNRKTRAKQKPLVADWQQDLKTEIEAGWTDYGQTNHLLKTIACYGVVFEGLEGEVLADYVERMAIAAPGYAQWCRHQHEICLRALVWARAAENYYWKLGDPPKREGSLHQEPANAVVPFNRARSEDAQQRIRDTLARLEAQGTLPPTPTDRAKAIAAAGNISLRTLYRYRDLWYPPDPVIESCKIADSERIPAIDPAPSKAPPDPPEPSKDGEFYTSGDYMKGKDFPLSISLFTFLYPHQHPLASAICESGTGIFPLTALKRLLERLYKKQTGTQNSFPQPHCLSFSPPGIAHGHNQTLRNGN